MNRRPGGIAPIRQRERFSPYTTTAAATITHCVGTEALQRTLRTLATTGTLVREEGRSQLWRFVYEERPYLLKFFPGRASQFALRGSGALAEFAFLQALQKALLPAPRAVAVLAGFGLADRKGDAVIYEAIEPAMPLDAYLNERELAGGCSENTTSYAAWSSGVSVTSWPRDRKRLTR